MARSNGATSLGDILERVLDRGLVIAGDIRVNLLDIELLTIKLRLLVASVDTARELGIDWWESDPWLHSGRRPQELEKENRELRRQLAEMERTAESRVAAIGQGHDRGASSPSVEEPDE
ncbi:MAG: gas vesicle protein [Catenulispora sp.]